MTAKGVPKNKKPLLYSFTRSMHAQHEKLRFDATNRQRRIFQVSVSAYRNYLEKVGDFSSSCFSATQHG
jgi:hypothetical protein